MHCCKQQDLVRNTDACVVLLKEPPVVARFYGHRCRNCEKLLISPADLARNQTTALRAARRVKVSPSMWRELFR